MVYVKVLLGMVRGQNEGGAMQKVLKENAALRNEVAEADTLLEQHVHDLAIVKHKLDSLQTKNSALEAEGASLQQNSVNAGNVSRTQEIHDLEAENLDFKAEIYELEVKLADSRSRADLATPTSNGETFELNDPRNSQFETYRGYVADAEIKLDSQAQKIDDLEHKNSELKSKLDDRAPDLVLAKENKELCELLTTAQNTIDSNMQTILELRDQVDFLRSHHGADLIKIKTENKGLRQAVMAAKGAIDELNAQLHASDNHRHLKDIALDKANGKICELNGKVAALEETVEEEAQSLNRLTDNLAECNRNRDGSENMVSDLREQVATKQNEVDALSNVISQEALKFYFTDLGIGDKRAQFAKLLSTIVSEPSLAGRRRIAAKLPDFFEPESSVHSSSS